MDDVRHGVVTEAQVETFDRDGVVLLRGAIDQAWQARLAEAIDRRLAANTAAGYFEHIRVWELDPVFNEYCLRSAAPAMAAQLLKTDRVNLYYDQLFVKEPGSATRTGWHNDQPYWPVRGWPVMTMWLALDRIGVENGALEFIPGSHKWDRWYRPFYSNERGDFRQYKEGDDPLFVDLPNFEAERDEHEIRPIVMEPGDICAFHALAVHGARGNGHTTARRRGYSVRYVGRGAVYHPGPATNSWLLDESLRPVDPIDSAKFPVAYAAG